MNFPLIFKSLVIGFVLLIGVQVYYLYKLKQSYALELRDAPRYLLDKEL